MLDRLSDRILSENGCCGMVSKNMTKYQLVITKQYLQQSRKWIEALRHGDSLSILFFRMTDRLRRIQQFLDQYDIRTSSGSISEFVFLVFDSVLHNPYIEDRMDLHEHLTKQLNYKNSTSPKGTFEEWMDYFKENKLKLVLIIPQAEEYHNVLERNIMQWLRYLVSETALISIMSFYEVDITNPAYLTKYPDTAELEQEIMYYPLYDEEDTYGFMQYLEKKWEMKVLPKEKGQIYEQSGGDFWFVKEAIRELRDHGEWSCESEGMQFRLRTLEQLLLPDEQSTLKKIIHGNSAFTPEEKHCLSYFKKMNFIDKRNNCLLKIFADYTRTLQASQTSLVVKNGEIVFNDVPLSGFFSRKEYRVFKKLLEAKEQVLTREQIARAIWPDKTDEHYSDWAIDQIVARLRKRLSQLTLPPEMIKSVRGKGYLFTH